MHLFELALTAAAVWTVRAYFWPHARCRRCGGSGRNKGSTGRRWGKCRRCDGGGSRQVLGSVTVHRAVRSMRSARKTRRGGG